MKLQMHSNELEHICEALNLIAEGIHTSHVFPKEEVFCIQNKPPEVF